VNQSFTTTTKQQVFATTAQHSNNSCLLPSKQIKPCKHNQAAAHNNSSNNNSNSMPPLQYLDPASMPADPVKHGAFVHGLTVFAGGEPHSVQQKKLPPEGVVLFTSSTLKPQSQDWAIKQGTSDERVGRMGSFEHGVLRKAAAASRDPVYTPRRGGLISHERVWSGGAPRDMQPKAVSSSNSATVLHEFPHLSPNLQGEELTKAGTDGERQGRRGSFECGDTHLFYHTPQSVDDVVQYAARRYGTGHRLAGATIFSGGSPRYTQRRAVVC
jgi:hypothetical protein